MRTLAMTLAALPLLACGGTIDLGNPYSNDAGSSSSEAGASDASSEASRPRDPPAFCDGTAPRMQINGADVTIEWVSRKAVYMDCCDSEELVVATLISQAPFYLFWRASAVTTAFELFDLSNPPAGFGIEFDLACDPAMTSCGTGSPAEDRYTDNFNGSIYFSRTPTPNGTTSYCVWGAESPSAPHPVIHSFALYAPAP